MVRIALNCVDREFDGLRGHRESGSTNNGDVRRLRSEGAGISQDALAARCSVLGFDIGRGTISHIETGLRGVSDLEMVILSRALRVPLDELVPAPPRGKRISAPQLLGARSDWSPIRKLLGDQAQAIRPPEFHWLGLVVAPLLLDVSDSEKVASSRPPHEAIQRSMAGSQEGAVPVTTPGERAGFGDFWRVSPICVRVGWPRMRVFRC